MCTIAHTPRLPEHCVEYAKVVLWPREREDESLDGDNPDHIKWLLEKATERAATFGIRGVT
jgi:ubiquitin-activating enzyme E1 C